MESRTVKNNVEMANDEGADPSEDIKKQNAGETSTADVDGTGAIHGRGKSRPLSLGADTSPNEAVAAVRDDDPHKVEKIADAAEPDVDHNLENPT
jgi:hypothetical protein